MRFITNVRSLLLAMWLGAACFFIAVAQSAFAVLPERELAGAVVNRTLSIVNYAGLIIAVVLLASSLVGARFGSRLSLWAERFLLLIVAAACAVGQFVIGFMLASLRTQLGRPIDQIAADDPLRLQFNQWHQYSEWTLSAGMFAALLAFFFLAGRISAARTAADTAETTSDPFNFDKPFKKT